MTSPREVIAKGSKTFALASVFLPREMRSNIYTLYAWLRHCDDVIDSSNSSLTDLQNLKLQLVDGTHEPIAAGLKTLIKDKNIPFVYFEEFFEGLRSDIENKGYDTFSELEVYCYRVAGVVGLIFCSLSGVTNEQALKCASALGIGMQLTNISRDVLEDAQNKRIYLPRKLMEYQCTAQEMTESPSRSLVTVKYLLARAEEMYEKGNQGLRFLPFRVAIAVGCASFLYRAIGKKIIRNMPQSLNERVVVGFPVKLRCLFLGLCAVIRSRFI
ncbi:MAG: phytoene/squalene synthase family protein [Bdellovibrio sp.]|nr:phytoene/squalene synthase family protein [Bdellovibrio sp.]